MAVAMHKSVLRTIKAITQKKFHMSGKDGTGKNLRELSLHTVKRMVKGKINSENWPVSKSTVKHHLHNNTLFGSVTRKKFLGASHKMECQASLELQLAWYFVVMRAKYIFLVTHTISMFGDKRDLHTRENT